MESSITEQQVTVQLISQTLHEILVVPVSPEVYDQTMMIILAITVFGFQIQGEFTLLGIEGSYCDRIALNWKLELEKLGSVSLSPIYDLDRKVVFALSSIDDYGDKQYY
ncbi:MAG: hypothetical protein EZS28_009005 [Streblomastix strix]|uniref:Uncharacterized protein n=1 Tax=Streblomastix strix TaxID=222440 RepID=A0A5J4WLG3_9EUKA|nr:MAG: hypothetical protein EZS28_009005 [Streblomastix strix]